MSTLLMMSKPIKHDYIKSENKINKDTETCLNCMYQGTGNKCCNQCCRSILWQYYKKPNNIKDNFKEV